MFKVQLFGRDGSGKCIRRDLKCCFATVNLAIDAAEAAAKTFDGDSRATVMNYRVTDLGGATILDVGVHGSSRRLMHRADAA